MNEQLQNLLADWEMARQEGRELDPVEMCADCPELLPEFKDAIAKLLQTSWLFEPDSGIAVPSHSEIPEPKPRAEFDAALRASGLVSDIEIDAVSPGLESEQAAAELRELGTLTDYQSEVLLGYRSGPLKLDRYVILDEIGEGGMGKVYRALHTSMNRSVALKMLSSTEISANRKQRFRREIESVAALNHPNIVTAHDACEIDGQFFLVMELIEGNDLLHEVETNGPMPFDMALEIIRQIASATEAAHERGIIHRDIKPSNILLANDGNAKLLDLGIARIQGGGTAKLGDSTIQDSTELTGEGTPVGTVAYMSPEQALNAKSADARSDIYSLGCTLFFLLTGKPPFVGSSVVETIVSHRETPVDTLLNATEIDDEAKSLLHRMIAKAPLDRFDSMQSLTDVLDGGEPKQPDVPRPKVEVAKKKEAAFPASWLLGAAILLAAIAGIAVWFSQSPTIPMDVESATWQNDFAKWVINNDGTVVAKTEFGEQSFDTVEAIPNSPIEITQLSIYELPTTFSAQWLTRLTNLNTLSFDLCTLTNSDAIQIKQLNKLEVLVLDECEVPTSLWTTLQDLPNFHTLTVTEMELTDQECENIGGLKQLAALTINKSSFSDEQFKLVEALKLEFLDLDETDVGRRPMDWAAKQSQLLHLDMTDTKLSEEDLKSVEPCKSLSLISLEGCKVGDAAVDYILKLPDVTDVYLGFTAISNSHLDAISRHPTIASLELEGSDVTGAGLEKLKGMKGLRILGLGGLKIDDSHMKGLVALSLDAVDLSGTAITDKGLAVLSGANLGELTVANCNLSEDALNLFMEQNPDCLVGIETTEFYVE